jgi:hypothetical protein
MEKNKSTTSIVTILFISGSLGREGRGARLKKRVKNGVNGRI